MPLSPRKKIKYHIEKINNNIEDIKLHLGYIINEIKLDYPHISALIVTVDDSLNMLQENFINKLDENF